MAQGYVKGSIAQFLASFPLNLTQGSNLGISYLNNKSYTKDISRLFDDYIDSSRHPLELVQLYIPFPKIIAKSDDAIIDQLLQNDIDNANAILAYFFDSDRQFNPEFSADLTRYLISLGFNADIIPYILNSHAFKSNIMSSLLMSSKSYAMDRTLLEGHITDVFIYGISSSTVYLSKKFDKPYTLQGLKNFISDSNPSKEYIDTINQRVIDNLSYTKNRLDPKTRKNLLSKINSSNLSHQTSVAFEQAITYLLKAKDEPIISALKAINSVTEKLAENFAYLSRTTHLVAQAFGTDHEITKYLSDLTFSNTWNKPGTYQQEYEFYKNLFKKIYSCPLTEYGVARKGKIEALRKIAIDHLTFTDLSEIQMSVIEALPEDNFEQKLNKIYQYRAMAGIAAIEIPSIEINSILALLKHANPLELHWLLSNDRTKGEQKLINSLAASGEISSLQAENIIFLHNSITAAGSILGINAPLTQELFGYAQSPIWQAPRNQDEEYNYYISFFKVIYNQITAKHDVKALVPELTSSVYLLDFNTIDNISGKYLSLEQMAKARKVAIDSLPEDSYEQKQKKLISYSKDMGYCPSPAINLTELSETFVNHLLSLAKDNQVFLFAETLNASSAITTTTQEARKATLARIINYAQNMRSITKLTHFINAYTQASAETSTLKQFLADDIALTEALSEHLNLLEKVQGQSSLMQEAIIQAAQVLGRTNNPAALKAAKKAIADYIITAVNNCSTPEEVKAIFEDYQRAKHALKDSPLKKLMVEMRFGNNFDALGIFKNKTRYLDHYQGNSTETSHSDSLIIKAMKRKHKELKSTSATAKTEADKFIYQAELNNFRISGVPALQENSEADSTVASSTDNSELNFKRKPVYYSTTFIIAASTIAVLSAAAIAVTAGLGVIPLVFLAGMTLAVKAAVIAAVSIGTAAASGALTAGIAKASTAKNALIFSDATNNPLDQQNDSIMENSTKN